MGGECELLVPFPVVSWHPSSTTSSYVSGHGPILTHRHTLTSNVDSIAPQTGPIKLHWMILSPAHSPDSPPQLWAANQGQDRSNSHTYCAHAATQVAGPPLQRPLSRLTSASSTTDARMRARAWYRATSATRPTVRSPGHSITGQAPSTLLASVAAKPATLTIAIARSDHEPSCTRCMQSCGERVRV